MEKEINNNSRSKFIKNLTWGLVSIFSLGIVSVKFSNNQFIFRNRFKTISVNEANERIRSISPDQRIKPEPPPKTQ
mgnify:CR=1 FL=1